MSMSINVYVHKPKKKRKRKNKKNFKKKILEISADFLPFFFRFIKKTNFMDTDIPHLLVI